MSYAVPASVRCSMPPQPQEHGGARQTVRSTSKLSSRQISAFEPKLKPCYFYIDVYSFSLSWQTPLVRTPRRRESRGWPHVRTIHMQTRARRSAHAYEGFVLMCTPATARGYGYGTLVFFFSFKFKFKLRSCTPHAYHCTVPSYRVSNANANRCRYSCLRPGPRVWARISGEPFAGG